MKENDLQERKTVTTIKDIKGDYFNPKLVDISIIVYELTPQEAQELNKKGYKLLWIHKTTHHKGEPKLRLYELIGKRN